jgi:hypothetical protein
VDERALLTASRGGRDRRSRMSRRQAPPAAGQEAAPLAMKQMAASNYAREVHCLGILLRRPDLLYQVDRKLRQKDLEPLSPADFQHADHQAIVGLFQQAVDQDSAEPLNYVLNSLDLPMMELADGLLESTTELDPEDERVLEDLMRGILDLRLRNLRQEIEYLEFMQKDAQEQGDVRASQYRQIMVKLAQEMLGLNKALKEYTERSTVRRRM